MNINNKSILALAMLAVLASAIVPMSAFAQEPEQTSEEEQFTVQVTAGEDTITRGSKQSINVETDQPAEITGSITYASSFTRAFFGTTGDDNNLTYEWKIGANSKPGTFAVKVIAISLDNQAATDQTTFTVTSAPALPPEEQETPEVPVGNGTGPVVDNGTITEGGNGTVIVPEEPININITLPADNQTEGGGNITIPSYNDTIPIPIPINDTSQNETIPIEIPVDPNTNQTVPLPELPTNETVPVSNETAPPVENVTQPGGENDTIIVTPDNETIPIDNGTIIVTEPPAGNVTGNETLPTEPPTNQTEELPDEIPINGTVGNVTEPIELPINSTTGNETIPIPPIDVEIPDNATLPSQNETAPEQPSNVTSPEVVSDIIAELQDRTTALENQSASRQEVVESVGTAIEQIGNAVSVVPGLTAEEQEAVVQSVNEVMQAIKNLG